jgi:hypothetical protein
MSIGSVEANFARLIVETTDVFQQVRREAAEAKLYYLRDFHSFSVEEFDRLVDEELHRATSISSEPEVSVKTFMRTIKCNISTLLKRRPT